MFDHVWNAIPDSMAVLDDTGRIVSVNQAWRNFGLRNGLPDPQAGLNGNYLEICDQAQGPDAALAQAAAAGIRDVLSGAAPGFEIEYPCHSPDQQRWFNLRAVPFRDRDRTHAALIHEDVTERRQSQWESDVAIKFLRLVNESADRHDLIERSVRFFREQSGCSAVGIRLRAGDDYPYFEARGFPEEFIRAENSLCTRRPTGEIERDPVGNPVLACMCGNVICGRFDPAKPFFTPNGSFWSNGTTELLASTTEADRQARTRNRCNGEGYESVALIPLRFGEKRLGLLQLNDRRQNMFSPRIIALWERLAGQLSVALAHMLAQEELRDSRKILNAVIEGTPDAVYTKDLQGRYTTFNSAASRCVGKNPAEVLGRDDTQLFPPEDLRLIKHDDNQVMTAGITKTFEEVVHTPTGITMFITTKDPLLDDQGKTVGMFGIARDITARKQAEETLRRQEAELAEAQTLARVGSWRVVYQDGQETWTGSEELRRIWGYPPGMPITMQTGIARMHPDDRVHTAECWAAALQRDETSEWQHRILVAGEVKWIRVRAQARRDAQGRVLEVHGTNQDITERKRAEDALRASEAELTAAQRLAQLGSWHWDLTTDTAHWSNETFRIFGIARGTLAEHRKNFVDMIHPEDRQRVDQALTEALSGIHDYDLDYRIRLPDGTEKVIHAQAEVQRDGAGKPLLMHGTIQDITERTAAHVALQASEERYHSLFNGMTEGFAIHEIITDAQGRPVDYRFLDINPAFELMTGLNRAQVVGKTFKAILPDEDPQWVRHYGEVALTGKTMQFEQFSSALQRHYSVLAYRPAPGQFATIFLDITQRKRAAQTLHESEVHARAARDELERFFTLVPDMVSIANTQGYLTKLNPAWEKVLGYSLDELMNKPFTDFIHPEDVAKTHAEVRRQVAGHTTEAFVNRYRCKDGSYKWLEWRATPVVNGTQLYAAARDITQRKLADQERELSIEVLRRINAGTSAWQLAHEMVHLLHERLDIQAVGIRLRQGADYPYLESCGLSPEFLAAENHLCQGNCAPDGQAHLACLCGCVIRGHNQKATLTEHGSFWTNKAFDLFEKHPELKSWTRGRCVAEGYRSIALIPLRLGGECLGLLQLNDWRDGRFTPDQIVFLERVADQLAIAFAELQAVESLRESEAKYRSLFDNAEVGMFRSRLDGSEILDLNDKYLKILGRTRAETIGKPSTILWVDPQEREQMVLILKEAGHVNDFECRLRNRAGEAITCITSLRLFPETGVLEGSIIDISERKRAQEQIELLKHSIDVQFDGAYWFDSNNRFVYVNDAGCRELGYQREELLGQHLGKVNPNATEEGLRQVWEQLRLTGSLTAESFHRRKDGTEFPVELTATYVQFGGKEYNCGFARDISQRKITEQEIARHQAALAHLARLNSLSQMTTGLAHELNQPLTAIRNYAHYCKTIVQSGLDLDVKLPEALDKVDQAVARASQVLQRMRDFVRKQEPTRTQTDMNVLLRKSLIMMGPILERAYVRIDRQFASRLPLVQIDQVQIEQVLINLQQNAMDAMSDTPVVKRALLLRTWADGGLVHVEVADRGCGIDPAIAARIFEEFFTTKSHGTGLGLSISKSIVDRHSGRLTTRPNPGGGTIFELVLPTGKGA